MRTNRPDDKEIAVCSVAFGEQYLQQMERLRESILKIAPSTKLFFHAGTMPEGARPMEDSLYGFKPHAINEARKAGYKYIFWLDPAIIMQAHINPFYIDRSEGGEYPVIAIEDTTHLADVCSQNAVKHFDIVRSWLCGKHLVGGSFLFFNFNNPITYDVFLMWLEAEQKGIFGTQQQEASEQLQGHRADETCLALALYKHKLKPMPYLHSRYNLDNNPILIKKHFK